METTPRRTFLKSAGLGLAAPFLARLAAAQRAFAEALPAATGDGHDMAWAERLRAAYSLDPAVTYLNHASIGTMPRLVQQAHRRYLALCEENPWLHMWGGAWEAPREAVRARAAEHLGCLAGDLAFIHNTTEAFNLLAQGLPLGAGDEVLFSSLNHPGASVCWQHQAARRGFTVRRFDFPLDDLARLDAERVVALHEAQITARTRVLVLPHVDNTIGLRHPVAALAARARARGVRWIAVDGAQSIGMLPVEIGALGVDLYASSPHKWLQAPKGLGLVYLGAALRQQLQPMWVTWGQERWRGTSRVFEDYGTRNLPEVLTLGDAIDFQRELGPAAKAAHHRTLWQHLRDAVAEQPRLRWRSPVDWTLAAALYAVEVTGTESPALAQRLFRDHGIVLRPFQTAGLDAVRVSPNVANSTAELDRLVALLAAA